MPPKIRKCQWLSAPEKARALSGRTIEFVTDDTLRTFVWTDDQDDSFTFSFERKSGSPRVGLSVIITGNDGLHVHEEGGVINRKLSVQGVESLDTWRVGSPVASYGVRTEGGRIIFSTPELGDFTSFSWVNTASSRSIGFWAQGPGEVKFTFS